MKLWLKYLLGIAAGILLGIALPVSNPTVRENLEFVSKLAVNIGRYALVPLVLFTVPLAVAELYEKQGFWKRTGGFIFLLLVSGTVFSLLGMAVALITSPARIPLLAAAEAQSVPGIRDVLASIFPENLAKVVGSSGESLLPLLILCLILGLGFCHDRIVTKPSLTLFDSLSRIIYQINSFLAEFLGILLIPLAAYAFVSVREGAAQSIYTSLLITVAAETLAGSVLVIPGLLWLLGGRKNPYPALYGLLGPAFASLVSGEVHFSMAVLQKHVAENLGVRRRINALTVPLALIGGRVGSALVTSTCFVVIISSYSSLGLTTQGLTWLALVSPLIPLLVGLSPRNGTTMALMALCALYGRGFENGYLIVAPLSFLLSAAGAFMDSLWAGCVSLIAARKEGIAKTRQPRFYI